MTTNIPAPKEIQMLNIQPIKLLAGTHPDTATTGSGCFMNVIAYLNGEPQITDQSPCVCPPIRVIAIWLNDFADQEQRQRLIPFIERAMGSVTEDKTELVRRAWLAADFASTCKDLAAKYAATKSDEYAASYAVHSDNYAKAAAYYAKSSESSESSANYVKSAAEYASASSKAAANAKYAAEYAANITANTPANAAKYAPHKEEIFSAAIKFLDAACPPARIPSLEVIERAQTLCTLAAAAA